MLTTLFNFNDVDLGTVQFEYDKNNHIVKIDDLYVQNVPDNFILSEETKTLSKKILGNLKVAFETYKTTYYAYGMKIINYQDYFKI